MMAPWPRRVKKSAKKDDILIGFPLKTSRKYISPSERGYYSQYVKIYEMTPHFNLYATNKNVF